ncbi:MAG TPA: glutamine-hydrolyzing carbamoyl-phosphate synthase small subunit [Microthrixaceae bacterium]|nr:glutamine-hydrolyzing carbamoyl-phosphate synthase small subunit [Microthrixaceae bacterium]
MSTTDAAIVLADGTTFEGEAFGAEAPGGVATGEFVFNTVLSGYQEVISDPSYAGQVITFTYPHIGNYGVNAEDDESHVPHCAGVVVREPARRHSSWRAEGDLAAYLVRHGIPGIAGIDTRRLTRHLRDHGSLPGAFGTAPESVLREAAAGAIGTDGRDLVVQVTTSEPYTVASTEGATRRIVAVDMGIKRTILRNLTRIGTVEVVPATTTADEIRAMSPDGLFLSNGPGDPAAVHGVQATTRELLGEVPIFGICLGHQILGAALGASTYKLPFGHHGGNHPVRDLTTGRIEITSQNHNYCVDVEGLGGIEVTHVNLNDGTVEGFSSTEVPAFGVQHHPEAGPGPRDSAYLFERFAALIDRTASGVAR